MGARKIPSQNVTQESQEFLLDIGKNKTIESLEALDSSLPLMPDQLDYFWKKLYPDYFQKFEFQTGFFEVDGNEIQFVDRSQGGIPVVLNGFVGVIPMGRSDFNNESVEISSNDDSRRVVNLSFQKIVQYLNSSLLQLPSNPESLKNSFWAAREKQQNSLQKIQTLALQENDMKFNFLQTKDRYLGKLFAQEHPKFLLDHIESITQAKLFSEKYLSFLVHRALKESPSGVLKNREILERFEFVSEEEIERSFSVADVLQNAFLQKILEKHLYPHPERLVQDLALELALDVWQYAKENLGYSAIARGISIEEKSLLIARYLFMRDISISTPQNIQEAVSQIEKKKALLKNVHLFSGREVIFAAGIEMNEKKRKEYGGERFGSQATQDDISKQSKKFYFFKPEKGNVAEVRKNILNKLKTIKSPFTFVFDGHGARLHKLSLGNAKEQISVNDIVSVLEERNDPVNLPLKERPIFIFTSCYGHNFIRKLYEELKLKNICLPICITASEYGQLGISISNIKHHTKIFTKIFQLGDKEPVTFQRLFINQLMGSSNFTIWGVDEENTPIQLVENEWQERDIENTA